jgi:ABC-2 type transport system permease protein/sodium transport system permease protein
MRKEVATILRDRRTIITLVLMPILLYPLLSVVFHQFLAAGAKPGEKQEIKYNIGLANNTEVKAFERQLSLGEWILERRSGADRPLSPADPGPQKEIKVFAGTFKDVEAALASGEIHLAVRIRDPQERGRDLAYWCDLYYLENSAIGLEVKEYVERRLAAANDEQLYNQPSIVVMAPRSAAVKDPGASGKSPLPALLPLILILMTITGAVYPAIDLTAGERERGTLEILVAAPVPRMSLLFAKYVSVVTVAFLTATVNLVMMTGTLLVSPLGSSLTTRQCP